jgi:SP family general alpha glucoside:H+ symporter-like MFS transporter
MPEGKGRTYAELDVLFESKVPARKFKSAVVDPFRVELVVEEATGEKVEAEE